MFTVLLSLFLVGSPVSYLDFEVKSEEELEALDYDIYNYSHDLKIVHSQNEAEIYYLDNRGTGTFNKPANPEERMVHVFTHSTEQVTSLIDISISGVMTDERSLQMLEHLDGFYMPDEGFEWRVFEIRIHHIESTDPNVAMRVSQEDVSVFIDENTEITHESIEFNEPSPMYELYERQMLTQYYAKLVPVNEPFYLEYQYPENDRSYVIYIDNISKFERESR